MAVSRMPTSIWRAVRNRVDSLGRDVRVGSAARKVAACRFAHWAIARMFC
jgi:hypothetical protein